MMTHSILYCFFFFKQKTAYEMRISDWSSDVCSSDLTAVGRGKQLWAMPEMNMLGQQRRLPCANRAPAGCLGGRSVHPVLAPLALSCGISPREGLAESAIRSC